MLREDDFLFAPLRRLVDLALRDPHDTPSHALDAAVRDAVGLDLATLDRLTPAALLAVLSGDDERAAERRRALAVVLDALAERGAAGDDRRAKAAALRAGRPC